jgi:hypothetical protein
MEQSTSMVRSLEWHTAPTSFGPNGTGFPTFGLAVLVVVEGPDGKRVDIDYIAVFANGPTWFFASEGETITHWAHLSDSVLP